MKKHLVMICGFHFPQSSATSACAERYVSLFKDEYDIDIISHTEDGKSYDLTDQSGYRFALKAFFPVRQRMLYTR